MFNLIRQHQRIMQFVLLILILPSFVLIGVSSYTNFSSNDDDLVKIGDTALTEQEFDRARRNQLDSLQRQYGASFDPSVVNTPEARRELVNSLIDRMVLIQVATKEGFSVSDHMLRQHISSIPELQEDGVFSADRYNQVLAASGISVRDFEQSQRAELAISRVLEPIGSTVQLPKPVLSALEDALTTTRTVQLLQFNAVEYAESENIKDTDIQAWYDSHQDELRLPQYVDVDYIVLDERAAIASVPVIDDEQLQQYYEQNRARFVVPARVQLRHVFVAAAGVSQAERDELRAKAEKIHNEIVANPEQFAAIAQSESDDLGSSRDGGELGWITSGSWIPELESAIFKLKKGEVSAVVEGPDGFHIFKADDAVAESGPSFADAKPEVEAEVRQQLAAERFADMATQLTDLVYDNSDSLNAAADTLGLPLRHAKGIARDGILPAKDIGEGAAENSDDAMDLNEANVRRALFSSQSLVQRQNAGVIELASDKLIAIRVAEIHEPKLLELEQVKDQIHDILVRQAAVAKAVEVGESTLASLQKGDAQHQSFTELQSVSRLDSGGLDKLAIDTVMTLELDQLPAYVGFKNEVGYTIAKVLGEEHIKPDPALMDFITQQLQQLWANAEEQATLQALRDSLKVNELPALTRVIEMDDDADF